MESDWLDIVEENRDELNGFSKKGPVEWDQDVKTIGWGLLKKKTNWWDI